MAKRTPGESSPSPTDADVEDLRDVLFGAVPESELLALGKSYESQDILDAIPAFRESTRESWDALSTAQREDLVGYEPAIEVLLGREADALATLKTQFDNQSTDGATSRAKLDAAAKRAHGRGVILRDQGYRTLRRFLRNDAAALAELDETLGVASTADKLARGLEGVAALIQRHRKAADDKTRRVMTRQKLTDRYAKSLEDAATRVRDTEKAASAPGPQVHVTQRKLDLQDGRVLYLARSIYESFRAAHNLDETILLPKTPGVLARLVDSRARSSKRDAEPEPAPKPEPAPA